MFVTWVVIELFVVGFSAAGERYSQHGSTTRSFFRSAADFRSHEGLRLPAHERRRGIALEIGSGRIQLIRCPESL